MNPQTEMENLVLATALELADHESCFVGIGVPSLAAMLAKRTHAPNLVLIYESGAIDANPPIPPLSTGSPSVTADTAMIGDCLDVFGDLQAGRIDVGLLSAAQVDRHGNLNSTVIGDYRKPKLRMVGSGGAHDIASLANRVVIVMPHDPKRFVASVDFITSPGFLERRRRAQPLRASRRPSCGGYRQRTFRFCERGVATGALVLSFLAGPGGRRLWMGGAGLSRRTLLYGF